MSGLKENTLKNFVVVRFIYPGRQTEHKELDIVPKSWIFLDNKKFKCYYPPDSPVPQDEVESIVKELKKPDPGSWDIYSVKCLYNIGMFCFLFYRNKEE